MPKAPSGWGRAGHRRAVVISAVVLAVVLGSAVTAWAAVSGGSPGYRTASVTRANVATTLTVVGNVEPVSAATESFQVSGQVATVTVTPGQTVTAGQTLGTLDTTALEESVSSAQSTVQADEAKLAEDEANQSSTAASSASSGAAPKSSSPSSSSPSSSSQPSPSQPSPSQPTTSTTAPPSGTSTGQSATITQDQATLTNDEATLNADQQKEAADLAQAQADCTSANTATPAGLATCEAALQTVSADEQQVSKDQNAVSKDETALGQALGVTSSGSGGGSSGPGGGSSGPGGGSSGPPSSPPTLSASALSSSASNATLTAAITGSGSSGSASGSPGATGASASGGNTDTPQQIASDQAAIDTAKADLINAQQSLNGATLTSTINGTVASVNIAVGDTVSANSTTETITIIGTNSYEAQVTLDSSQVPSVKVGQSASVEVDGLDGKLAATVAQVGPVESSSSGYSYPVVVALPATGGTLHAGSAANVTISTGKVSHVVAVPTSAVQTVGSRSFVLMLSKGQLTRQAITIGMVGDEYSQVLSGLTPGQSIVLADYGESVPSSSTNTVAGLGNLLGGGGGGFPGGAGFPGGGGGVFPRISNGVGGKVVIGG